MQDHLIVPVGVSVAVGFLSLDRSRPGRLFVADETSAIWVIQDVFHPEVYHLPPPLGQDPLCPTHFSHSYHVKLSNLEVEGVTPASKLSRLAFEVVQGCVRKDFEAQSMQVDGSFSVELPTSTQAY
eukprot:72607-Pelagomonas_calceolata.AAC.2